MPSLSLTVAESCANENESSRRSLPPDSVKRERTSLHPEREIVEHERHVGSGCRHNRRRNRSADHAGDHGAVVVFATTLFNLVLCFVNTTLFGIGVNVVIGTEIALIGMALGLIWYRGYALYTILLVLTAYFFAVMLIRSEFDPKIARDLLIPIVFFFLGQLPRVVSVGGQAGDSFDFCRPRRRFV